MASTDTEPDKEEHTFAIEEHPIKVKGKRKSTAKGKRCLFIVLAIILVLLLLGGIVILVLLLLFVGRQPPRAQTTYGTYEGTYHLPAEVFSFKGIPYAMPPVGKRRWQPPFNFSGQTPPENVIDAKDFPPECKQQASHSTIVTGQEDCLYLNVFTPDIDTAAKLPVMVYIHGGYLQWGNASHEGYCPDHDTAKLLNVVLVSIQYRLNAFGFLVLDKLPGRKGNYGLLDQIEALRWVKANIRNFGGDPDQVTLFGQSSGGTSIFALMTTPKAKGLFHKAWIISGSPILDKPLKDASEANRFFLNKTGCSSEECLMNLEAEEVLSGIYPEWDPIEDSMDLPTKGYFELALPVVDGDLFPLAPFEMWEQRKADIPDVPVIIGVAAQEVDIFPRPNWYLKYWDLQDVQHHIEERLEPFGPNMVNKSMTLYSNYTSTAELLFTTMTSDVRMVCGNIVLMEKASAALSQNVYGYIFTSFPSSPADVMGYPAIYALHAWDLYAFFNTFEYVLAEETQESDRQFGDNLRRNIMNFVRNGEPRDSSWEQFPESIALISDKMKAVKTYHKEQCDFWLDNGFFPYSWVN